MKDKMTEGSIYKILISLAGPILLGQILQQIYNVADTVIIGRFVGKNALAGIGSDWAVNYIITFFCIGSCTAISVPLSQSIGAKDNSRLRKYFYNGIYCAGFLAVVLTTIMLLFSDRILYFLSTPKEVFDDAYIYLIINMAGLVFTILYNFCFGVLMAFGDSKRASAFMAVSTLVNIVMDLFLIIVMRMGVAGAAVATVLAEAMAGIASFAYIYREYKVLFELEDKNETNVARCYIFNICKMCLPMGVQYSITAIGALVLQGSLNNLSTDAIAAYSVGQKIKSILLCPLSALGTALSSFVGQNFGANNISRIKKGVHTSLLIGGVYSIIMIVVAFIFNGPVTYLFVSGEDIITCEYIKQFIIGCSFFNLLLSVLFSYRFCVQGMGYGRYAVLSSIAEMMGRAIAGLWLVPRFGFSAVTLSEGLTFAAGIIVIVPICTSILRKYIKKTDIVH